MSASCINEYNECNKGYLIPHEGTTSRLIVIPTYICLVILYDTDLVFCLCIYTFNKFNQSINQSSRTFVCFSTSKLLADSAAASLFLDCINSDCIVL